MRSSIPKSAQQQQSGQAVGEHLAEAQPVPDTQRLHVRQDGSPGPCCCSALTHSMMVPKEIARSAQISFFLLISSAILVDV